jgi:hypothetical protein
VAGFLGPLLLVLLLLGIRLLVPIRVRRSDGIVCCRYYASWVLRLVGLLRLLLLLLLVLVVVSVVVFAFCGFALLVLVLSGSRSRSRPRSHLR